MLRVQTLREFMPQSQVPAVIDRTILSAMTFTSGMQIRDDTLVARALYPTQDLLRRRTLHSNISTSPVVSGETMFFYKQTSKVPMKGEQRTISSISFISMVNL
jgi:hypothetical protein